MSVAKNYQEIQQHIENACNKVGRDKEDITVIAVTKYATIETAQEAVAAGVRHLGENRLEGFQEKKDALGNDVSWHFIGTLQSRKVKDLIHDIDILHSLDRKSLAKEIHKRAEETVPCFVQVNVSGEESKHGLAIDEVKPFIESLSNYDKVKVIGLMTMAPHTDDEEVLRQTFRSLRRMRDEIMDLQLPHAPCQYLSMGMSNDYQIAIEEGATHIRVGSKLVGSYQS
ncbi:hypothetical protein GGQ92_000135 [Gracilibacillus halotolerans]|uniref:Pyridoxal phosphate homeostasis protein n=1 Tax=Gracilibacillus halotolerans TaxID=74386 RepID=A0A841RKU6_9BACI|nr:YggS family pyridoxal phosphate-dependent enzyme [Gracilibacillus halotolerans]MBB6511368.1 hypothetical protein [Gracilibacillus halotolerans]